MATTPAEVLLGRLTPASGGFALLCGAAFAVAARLVGLRAIRCYTSASS